MKAREEFDRWIGVLQIMAGPYGPHPTEAQLAEMRDARTRLLDAYRTEAIGKAIGRLRAIPVTCTALTGPVWYGEGWKSAITTLEEIAEYQLPDDEAYPGELARFRGLVRGLRVAARKGDMDGVQRMLLDHAAFDGDERDRVKKLRPDFFEVGRTYASGTWRFRCEVISPSPGTSERRALGWKYAPVYAVHHWYATALDPDDWAHGGWSDVTTEAAR